MIERLVAIETKIDHINSSINSHEIRINKLENSIPHKDHEDRIRRIERVVWLATGAAGVVGGAIGKVLPALGG